MKCNVGQKDKKLRTYAGIALMLTAITVKSPILAIVGTVLLVTGYIKFCPAYTLLNIDTSKNDSNTPPAV